MKKILIAGAGHGGLVVGAKLAKNGYDVHVFERFCNDKLGYPWDDMMNRDTFDVAEIEYDIKDIILHPSVTMVPPSLKNEIKIEFPEDKANFEIERKVLYRYLIENAKKHGVNMHFEHECELMLNENNKVSGLKVNGQEVFGDLVIDASGGNSKILNALPTSYNIKYNFTEKSQFFTYRGRFEVDETKEINFKNSFAMYLLFNGIRGISWFKIVDGLADVLIGSIDPINEEMVEKTLNEMKKAQPSFTKNLKTGGQFNTIPFGPPIENFIGDNYVAIGDSACMATPINGSGISNSIYAAKILADVIMCADAKNENRQGYTVAELYNYQKEFMLKYGAKMHEIACLKDFLLALDPRDISFIFEKQLISEDELNAAMFGKDVKLTLPEMLKRGAKGISNIKLLLNLSKTLNKSKAAAEKAAKPYK